MTLLPPDLEISDAALKVLARLESAGYETWFVGGALRDTLLGDHSQREIDIATSALPGEVQRLFGRTVPIGIDHGTVGILENNKVKYEVTTFRRDVKTYGRHAVVEFGASIDEDLARRDFTINALAYHPKRGWKDLFGGEHDLASGIVRAVGDPQTRFREDYLRVLRAIRFAARFGFQIEQETWLAACLASPGLAFLSAERVRDEWFKSLRTARDLLLLVVLWHQSGASAQWLPGLTDWDSLAPNPMLSMSAGERDPVVYTVLLSSQPVQALQKLKSSNREIARAKAMVVGPASPVSLNEVDVRRWLAQVGKAADDLITLSTLRLGTAPEWAETAHLIRLRGDPIARGDLAVTGNDLKSIGLSGPEVGAAIERLLDIVIIDPKANTKERLLALVRSEA